MRPELSFAVEAGEQPRPETDVSEQEKSGDMHPQQNPQTQQTTEVVVDDSRTQPTYANFCRVTATPEEIILDFGLNTQPFATGRQEVKASQRIVMNAYTTKRLLMAIGQTIQRHEQNFGVIELDVQPPRFDATTSAGSHRRPRSRRPASSHPTGPLRDLPRGCRQVRNQSASAVTRNPRTLTITQIDMVRKVLLLCGR